MNRKSVVTESRNNISAAVGRKMKKIYEKSELSFAIVWIVIYCIAESLANPLSQIIGIENSAHAIFNIALTVILFFWIKKNSLFEGYGLCKTSVSNREFLWYIPLVILASHNLWNGVAVLPLAISRFLFSFKLLDSLFFYRIRALKTLI